VVREEDVEMGLWLMGGADFGGREGTCMHKGAGNSLNFSAQKAKQWA
jgi:hypothetical protein